MEQDRIITIYGGKCSSRWPRSKGAQERSTLGAEATEEDVWVEEMIYEVCFKNWLGML